MERPDLGLLPLRNRLEQGLKAQFQEAAHQGPNPAPLRVCCVALGKSHNRSVPQCPHLQRRLLVCTGGIIANIFTVVVSLRECYRAFLARPGTPHPPTRQGLTAWGLLHHGTHHGEARCELRDPPVPSMGPGELRLGLEERGQEGSAPPSSWPETDACPGHS